MRNQEQLSTENELMIYHKVLQKAAGEDWYIVMSTG